MPRLVLFLAALAALAGCATPVAPTGGPADTTPPALVETVPADGATNVTDRTARLVFSERLATTAAGAVSVTPQGEVPPEVSVSGRELTVTFPSLRDSTTYVITVGTDLADQRSVSLRAPVVVAFATGDTIDRGRIAGAVRQPETGEAAGGLGVWAYALADTTALPDPRAVAPDYRTEAGEDGTFRLEYLRPGPYFVVAVNDRNRNRRLDAGEAFAAPPTPVLRADTAATDSARAAAASGAPVDLFVTALDTIPPTAQRVRPLSDRRLAVRFDEPVRLLDAAVLAERAVVADSASGAAVPVVWYQPAGSDFEVVAEAARALPPVPVTVTYAPSDPPALADSAGLVPVPFRLAGTPPERADTLRARVDAFLPAPTDSVFTLRRGERPGVRFTAPPGPLLDGVRIEVEGEPQPIAFDVADGVSVRADTAATLPVRFSLVVETPDSTYRQRFAFPADRETGGVVGRVEADDPVVIELRPESGPVVRVAADAEGRFVANGLLPGAYAVRVFVDRDGDGRWSGGALAPYRPPEPLVFLPDVTVRARWETEIDPVVL